MTPDRFGLYDYGRMPADTRRSVAAICKVKAEKLTKSGILMVPCSAACAACVTEAKLNYRGKIS